MKLMKEIRRKIPKVDPIPLRQLSQQMSDKDPDTQALPFFQMVRHSELYPFPQLDLTEAYLISGTTITIRQCMNSASRKNPIQRKRETKAKSHTESPFPNLTSHRTQRTNKWPKSWTQTLFPILITGFFHRHRISN
jgi:hypothetical protein